MVNQIYRGRFAIGAGDADHDQVFQDIRRDGHVLVVTAGAAGLHQVDNNTGVEFPVGDPAV